VIDIPIGQGRTRHIPVPAPGRMEGSELPGRPVRRVFGWHTGIPGCAYYRVQLPLRTLAGRHGWYTRFGQKLPLTAELDAALAAGRASAAADIAAFMAERYDVVIGQQVGAGGTGADAIWQAMARHRDRTGGPMLVLETDDDLMSLHSGHQADARREMEQRANTYRRAIEVADVVTVTTPALADSIVMTGTTARVVVIPNYIDSAMFDVPGAGQHVPGRPRVAGAGLRLLAGGQQYGLHDGVQIGSTASWPDPDRILIGWGGSSTHRTDFALAWPGLRRLLLQRQDVCFATMGTAHHVNDPALGRIERRGQLAGLAWLEMDQHPWSAYWARVGYFDVGLAPLERNTFNAAKSWIKILEYAAMGVPFVASASPEYRRFWEVGHGLRPRPDSFSVLVSHDAGEHVWYAALRAMTSDRAELARMQGRARIYARGFTIQDHIGEWADALSGR
jgi:glycosyltransferase involved in cell wall biosynthesis